MDRNGPTRRRWRRRLGGLALIPVVAAAAAASASAGSSAQVATSPAVVASPSSRAVHGTAGRRTTSAAIAMANLDSQIAGIEELDRRHPLTVAERANLVDLLDQRGQLLGKISDYERAAAVSETLVREHAEDGRVWLARARASTTFHLFTRALGDVAEAERHGVPLGETEGVRAAILQATGKLDEALLIRRRAATSRPNVTTLAAEATVYAARGELAEAERRFAAALASYRDVSPFPVAWIDFQRGLMWMRENELERASTALRAAADRVPQYAPAVGHLGEVEAALGNVDAAVALLEPLAATSEDPDYAAQLARILLEAGRRDEAKPWREKAAVRYDELMAKHPEAFADHAAEFWLAAGGDPARALGYAERNLALRPTVRAWELVMRAARAKGDGARACAAATGTREAGYLYASARKAVDEVLAHCPGCAE